MKDKILFLIIGMLLGAMITTGVFMIINKNKTPSFPNQGNFQRGDFSPENLDGATKTILEDGTEQFTMPDGRTVMRRDRSTEGGNSGGRTIINNP